MFKVTIFPTQGLPAQGLPNTAPQFGNATAVSPAVPVDKKIKPAQLLEALEADMFTRMTPPDVSELGGAEEIATSEEATDEDIDPITALELKYGDHPISTLMVIDELQHLITRLNLKEGDDAMVSVISLSGQDHLLIEAAHEGIYSQLRKGLQELGATPDAENGYRYADIPLHLFEAGLEADFLPKNVLAVKSKRESLAKAGGAQDAVVTLGNRLAHQGLKDIQVHLLAFEHPGQLWVLYPTAAAETRNVDQEKSILDTVKALPDVQLVDHKPVFFQGSLGYPVVIAPNNTAPRQAESVSDDMPPVAQKDWAQRLTSWVNQAMSRILQFFQNMKQTIVEIPDHAS